MSLSKLRNNSNIKMINLQTKEIGQVKGIKACVSDISAEMMFV
jgi:hypothetical protein